MFDVEKIKSFTVDEVIIMNELLDVAKEAKEFAKLIRDTYQFPMGEDKITVWSDGHNAEYLTHNGVWQARYLHQSYDVECSEDSIFKYLRAEYLVSHGFCKEFEDGSRTEDDRMAFISRYFRSFVVRTVNLASSKAN